jgi:hypothetical protein
MTYETKMVLRLAAPAVVVFVAGLGAADSVSSLPLIMGGKPALPGLGDMVAVGSGLVALVVYVARMFQYWRWTRSEAAMCFVCSCLLGREREGRFGPYRKCLGCGKNHALGSI